RGAGARRRATQRVAGEAVARDREQDPRGGGGGAQRGGERAHRRAEVDDVREAGPDVVLAEVAERTARLAEALDARVAEAEPEALGDHADDVERAGREYRDQDGARDVAAGIVGLLPQRGCALEAAEGQEAEHRRDRDGRERDPARR